jgi:hypothetical protein
MAQRASSAAKSLLFGGVILIVWLACLELAVGMASVVAPKLFGHTAAVTAAIDQIDPERFAKFSARARGTPAVWSPHEGTIKTKSCLGESFDVTYDGAGARLYPGYDARLATVLLIGDSYTAGDEVGNEHTISAHLYKRAGIVSANLGVGGYSPLQAVLNLETRASSYPSAKIVVLGIMHENIRRNVNSYIAVFTGAEGVFGVRPYVRGGSIRFVPQEVFDSLDNFKAYAGAALRTDFWAFPSFAFPYTASLVDLMSSRSFWIRNKSRVLKLFDRQYAPDFADPDLAGALSVVIDRFAASAAAAGFSPLVIFFPQNKNDLSAPKQWLEAHRRTYGNKIDIQIMESSGVDWSRYNQKPDGSCHASSYGYDMIARAYAKALSKLQGARQPPPPDPAR